MSVIVAPWLHGTDVLGSMQAGGHLGLSARARDQADAEMQMRAELAAQQKQEEAQKAAEQLRYHYDVLKQANDLALADDDYRSTHDATEFLQKKTNADALAVYRAGVLKNQEARLNHEKGFQGKGHFAPNGDYFKEVEPGVVKQLFTAPPKPVLEKIPTITGVPLDPLDPAQGKVNALANNPILNKLMGTNSYSSLFGTNFVAPMPKLTPKAQAPAPATPPATEFKKGKRVIQGGKTYEFDGKDWIDLTESNPEPDSARIADAEDQPDETDDEEA